MINEIPRLKIEIEGIKRNIVHAFNQNDKELSIMVMKTIEETLNAEWVQNEINHAVNLCIKNAIADISNNYTLKSSITSLISESISKLVESKE